MTLQNTDKFLVSRNDINQQVDAAVLMSKLQDTDLMVVCRGDTPYKATGAEIKDSFGSPSINPGVNDITLNPTTSGDGSEANPFILQGKLVTPYGGSTESIETITIIGQPPNAPVTWQNLSTDSGSRFTQISGETTDVNGVWTGTLDYVDIPESTEDKVYIGKLKIGIVYFQWTITQKEVEGAPTVVEDVSLIEATQGANRFTDQQFSAQTSVIDGVPTSVKTFDAHVDGTISKQVKFDEPLESFGSAVIDYEAFLSNGGGGWSSPDNDASKAFDGDPDTYAAGTGTNSLTWDTSTFPLSGKLSIKIDPTKEYQISVAGSFGSTSNNYPANTTSGIVDFPNWYNGFTEIVVGTPNSSQYDPQGMVYAFYLDDQEFIQGGSVGSPTSLTFATGTNMEALAGGDTVNQTSNFTEPLESSTTIDYLIDQENIGDSSTPVGTGNNIAAYLFDGNIDTVWSSDKPRSFGGMKVSFGTPIINTTGLIHIATVASDSDVSIPTIKLNGDTYTVSGNPWPSNWGFGQTGPRFAYTNIAVNTGEINTLEVTTTGGITCDVGCVIDLNAPSQTPEEWKAAGNFTAFPGAQGTSLTFPANTDMAALAAGDGVSQGATTGTVNSITGTTVALSSSTGAWANGVDVTTGDKTTTGTVSSVSDTTASLSSSSGAWVNGLNVIGPQKTIAEQNARLYCVFDSNGNITDLQEDPQDPPYTTQDSNPGLTLTFPSIFPSGQTPDEELTEGTTITVEVTAENSTSSSGPVSATVQPEPAGPDAPLAGLTTLYTGTNQTPQTIVNGINLSNDGGLVWLKCRSVAGGHSLYDTERGAGKYLESQNTNKERDVGSESPISGLTSFNSTGFTIGATFNTENIQDLDHVAWTFGKAEGYFDVVTYPGNLQPKDIPHSLSVKPGMILLKDITQDGPWRVYHSTPGATKFGTLNTDEEFLTASSMWNDTEPTDTDFTVGNDTSVNSDGNTYVAYLFAEDTPNVIKCGITGGAGTQVEVGFKPQWVLFKNPNMTVGWTIADSKRYANKQLLFPDTDGKENFTNIVEFNDTGFIQNWDTECIYVAIAEPPITRSQTNEEFVESQAKFLTYDNRRDINQGQEAMNKRSDLIAQADNLGLTQDQITKLFND